MKNFYSIVIIILFSILLSPIKIFSCILPYLTSITLDYYTSGIDLVDCIYVINLKEREKRWESIKQGCIQLGLQINRVDAINGWKLNSEDLKKCL